MSTIEERNLILGHKDKGQGRLRPKMRMVVPLCGPRFWTIKFILIASFQEQNKSSDIEQQPPFADRKISNIQPQNSRGGVTKPTMNLLNISRQSHIFACTFNLCFQSKLKCRKIVTSIRHNACGTSKSKTNVTDRQTDRGAKWSLCGALLRWRHRLYKVKTFGMYLRYVSPFVWDRQTHWRI